MIDSQCLGQWGVHCPIVRQNFVWNPSSPRDLFFHSQCATKDLAAPVGRPPIGRALNGLPTPPAHPGHPGAGSRRFLPLPIRSGPFLASGTTPSHHWHFRRSRTRRFWTGTRSRGNRTGGNFIIIGIRSQTHIPCSFFINKFLHILHLLATSRGTFI